MFFNHRKSKPEINNNKISVTKPKHGSTRLVGCGEGKCNIYCKAPYKEPGTPSAQKA